MSRRNAALFLGLGVMFYRARHAPPSELRSAMTAGFSATISASIRRARKPSPDLKYGRLKRQASRKKLRYEPCAA